MVEPSTHKIEFLNLNHLHSFLESIVERTMQYIKDRVELFDDDYLFVERRNVI